MNAKIISAILLLLCASLAWLWMSNLTHSNQGEPTTAQPQQERHQASQPIQVSSPTQQPKPPEASHLNLTQALLPKEAIRELQNADEETKRLLLAAPDDPTGKQSRWFKPLNDWQVALSKAAKTGTRSDLFALVPTAAAFFSRDREAEPLAETLTDFGDWMQAPGQHIIRELAKAVVEGKGTFDDDTAAIAVQVFSVRGFVSEPDWEDERMPLDAPGAVIALASNTESIEALAAKQLAHLVPTGDAQSYFRRYETGGDGLPVLKQRFSDERQAIILQFGNMAAKAAAYRAGAESRP